MKSNFKNVGINEIISVVIDCYNDDIEKTKLLLDGHGGYDYNVKSINKRKSRFFVKADLGQVTHLYNMIKEY